jgi:type III pantothenate kinase
MDAMAEALHLKAAQLPKIDVSQPESLIGNSTVASIRSGVYYGYVAMVEGLLEKIQSGTAAARVVVTGGNATEVTFRGRAEVIVDPNLILDGLRLLFKSVPPA